MADIEVLDDVEAVRRRPGMYVGDVYNGSGLQNLARILIEQFVEEHRREGCYRLVVTVHRSGALTLESDGRVLALQGPKNASSLLTTMLDAFENMAFVCANALAESLVVELSGHRQTYRRGRPQSLMGSRSRSRCNGE